MNSKRTYFTMVAIIGLLFAGLVLGAYGTSVVLTSQAVKLTKLKAKSAALEQEQTALILAKKQVARYKDLNKIVTSVVPQDKDQAESVREIVNIANQNSIALGSITFPASTLGVSVGTATVPGGGITNKPFSGTGTSKSSSLSQLIPVKNIPGVYNLQITVQGDPTASVPYSSFINFLSSLEHNRRTAQVNTITIVPDAKNSKNVTFSLSLDEYIKP